MIEFVCNKDGQLYKCIAREYPDITFGQFGKLLRKKDIKVNSVRVSDNIQVKTGDNIQVYIIPKVKTVDIVYQDDNIVIVNKPINMEVISDEECVTSILSNMLDANVIPCHRLDRNTTGLVVFAKSTSIEAIMEEAFKEGYVHKYYMAKVFGSPHKQATLTGYLFKDSKNAQVFIEGKKTPMNKKIITKYKLVSVDDEICTLEVEIPTGRTHQIRAHLASVGLPIVGDNKYGDESKNKEYRVNRQQLVAYKLVFDFPQNNTLCYLNDKIFTVK